jgi:isopenicillin-N N-acyltransferase-like protein
MRKTLLSSPVTSGHNYLLSDPNLGEHWEITPEVSEKVASVEKIGEAFHTNHCLGEATSPLEMKESLSSTTFVRYDLLADKIKRVNNAYEMKELLMDHEGYPKSICSHFQSGAQDPSMTCGGAVADFTDNYYSFWRGCPVYDQNFLEHNFNLEGGSFSQVK